MNVRGGRGDRVRRTLLVYGDEDAARKPPRQLLATGRVRRSGEPTVIAEPPDTDAGLGDVEAALDA